MEQVSEQWYREPLEQVWGRLASSPEGLTSQEAANRLEQQGPNLLPEKPPVGLAWIFARQFINPLIYILVFAGFFSLVIGDFEDATFIGIVLLINAFIGAYQEWKAERSSDSLKRMLTLEVLIRRDGHLHRVDSSQLVPGDIVQLESGQRVPADMRLVTDNQLTVDESLLTGESLAVSKQSKWIPDQDVGLAQRQNLLHAGTVVVRGRAKGVVVATGCATQVGRLARQLATEPQGTPPLVARMERFTRWIAIATLSISLVIGTLGLALERESLDELHEVVLFVIALAVAAIPEGLPVAMTVALAIAAARMARRGLVVRRLSAVEGLGSCTLIATDKTGTLTCNELTVERFGLADGTTYQVAGRGFSVAGNTTDASGNVVHAQSLDDEFLQAIVLCNEADLERRNNTWHHQGDAVDVAFLVLAVKLGVSLADLRREWKLEDQIPFESESQFAAVQVTGKSGKRVYAKGAPERILSLGSEPTHHRQQVLTMAEELAGSGYRVLALAMAELPDEGSQPLTTDTMPPLQWLGWVAMVDPLRDGVKDAIAQCHRAGVEVVMVTGDHHGTATAIARQLNLAPDHQPVMTGNELARLSPEQKSDLLQKTHVFARVEPRQKWELVQAAQQAGHFVAVTGDGVNDAPALRTANIGVAMGRSGTDVARETASLVITDDNFATLVAGVEEGRIAYDNIRKVIYLLLSTGAAELLMVMLTVATGLPLPLLPIQLLWLNLVTNGIQGVAIAFEPGEPGILDRKPRSPSEPIFNRLMLHRMIVGVLVMGGVSYASFAFLLQWGWSVESARNFVLLLMVLFENVHIGNCRSETQSALASPPWKSRLLMFGALAAFLIHLVGMSTPGLNSILHTHTVSLTTWCAVIALSLTVLPAIEAHKWWWRKTQLQ